MKEHKLFFTENNFIYIELEEKFNYIININSINYNLNLYTQNLLTKSRVCESLRFNNALTKAMD